MEVLCKQCGNPTVAREVQKGPSGPWTAYECNSGCMNDKGYKLSTSPKRDSRRAPAPLPPVSSPTMDMLKQIDSKLDRLIMYATDPLEKKVNEG